MVLAQVCYALLLLFIVYLLGFSSDLWVHEVHLYGSFTSPLMTPSYLRIWPRLNCSIILVAGSVVVFPIFLTVEQPFFYRTMSLFLFHLQFSWMGFRILAAVYCLELFANFWSKKKVQKIRESSHTRCCSLAVVTQYSSILSLIFLSTTYSANLSNLLMRDQQASLACRSLCPCTRIKRKCLFREGRCGGPRLSPNLVTKMWLCPYRRG